MKCDARRVSALVLALMFAAYLPARAAEEKEAKAPEGQKFLRFVEDGKDGGKLEVAVATYKNDKGVQVQLIGAVHIADPGYYQSLNKLFEGYDALLYEMVKPKDMGAPRREEANGISFVHILQKGM